MQLKSSPFHRSASFSPRLQSLTPRKFMNTNKSKGLLLTLTKISNNQLQTQDKTKTPSSVQENKLLNNNQIAKRELFKNQKVLQSNSNNLWTDYKYERNSSLPSSDLHTRFTSFTTASKTHSNRLNQFSHGSKNPQLLRDNSGTSSPFYHDKKQMKHYNPMKSKLRNGQLLNFDSPLKPINATNHQNRQKSPSMQQSFNNSLKRPSTIQINSTDTQKQYSSPYFKKQSILYFNQQKSLQSDKSIITRIQLMQTPKKDTSKLDSNLSNFKNLRTKITKNIFEDGPSTISSKGIFQNYSNDSQLFQFKKSNILKNIKFQNNTFQKDSFKKHNKSHDHSPQQLIHIKQQQLKTKQKQDFFNLTPKISQQYEIDMYQLTQSPIKYKNSTQNNKRDFASENKCNLFMQYSQKQMLKNIKRKLSLKQQSQNVSLINQSIILRELVFSLNPNTDECLDKQKNTPFNIVLVRKCSDSLSLVRNVDNNLIFGLTKLNSNQKFIKLFDDKQYSELCLDSYCLFKQTCIIEPFQYSLEQIFQMKLVQTIRLPQLIKKFHKIINKIKSQDKQNKINLKKLKQRIVYIHGQFKLIPIVQKQTYF